MDSGKVIRGTSAALCALLALTPALVLPFTPYPAVANIFGVGVAAAVAAWMALPKVQLGLAVALLAIATVLSTTAPYWVYVAIITPGAVMFASQGNDTLGVDYLRLAYTLVAVGLVVVTALLGRFVWRRLNLTAQRRADEEHKAIVAARSRRDTQSGSGPMRRDDTGVTPSE